MTTLTVDVADLGGLLIASVGAVAFVAAVVQLVAGRSDPSEVTRG
ncbi:MAG: hypothetical protein ACLGHQ_07305 [Acidimicrobiia bacterium]